MDVSKNSEIQNLDCGFNQIRTLDLTNNAHMLNLRCFNNQLDSLVVVNNLWVLDCNNNQLVHLDMAGAIILNCSHNKLSSLILRGSKSLFHLDLSDNLFSACALGTIFSGLSSWNRPEENRDSLPLRFSVAGHPSITLSKDSFTVPGANGCREYLATEKGWKVIALKGNDTIHINNSGYYTCEDITLEAVEIGTAVSIYPNPVDNLLQIQSDIIIRSGALFSLTCQLIRDFNIVGNRTEYSCDLSALPAGI